MTEMQREKFLTLISARPRPVTPVGGQPGTEPVGTWVQCLELAWTMGVIAFFEGRRWDANPFVVKLWDLRWQAGYIEAGRSWKSVYWKGRRAYQDGFFKDSNPFREGHPLWHRWIMGWEDGRQLKMLGKPHEVPALKATKIEQPKEEPKPEPSIADSE